MTSGGVLHTVIDDNVGEFNWRQGDSSSMSLLPDCCWGRQLLQIGGFVGHPSTRLMHHFFFRKPWLHNKKSYHLYDLGKKPRLKLCWSILTHWDSFLAVLAQDSLTAVNFVTLIWWTLFLAPPAYKVLPSIYLNHPLPWSKAAKRSRSMFDAWDSSQKLRLGRGSFTQPLHWDFFLFFCPFFLLCLNISFGLYLGFR